MNKTANKIFKEASLFSAFRSGFGKVKDTSIASRFHTEATRAAQKGKGSDGMSLPKMVGVIVAAIGINQFAKNMVEYAKEKNIEYKKPEFFVKMIQKNPQLMEEDPEEVMDLWNSLYHNSYHLAQDPIAAGGFIRQTINSKARQDLGGPPIDTYSTLNNIESSATSSRKDRLDSAGFNLTDKLIAGLSIGAQ